MKKKISALNLLPPDAPLQPGKVKTLKPQAV
jgi:hypothetical protein